MGDTFTYSLVAGSGDTHNGLVVVGGGPQIVVGGGGISVGTHGPLSFRVRVTDSGGLWFEDVVTLQGLCMRVFVCGCG